MEVNQYLFIKNNTGEIIEKRKWDGQNLIPLKFKTIDNYRFNNG